MRRLLFIASILLLSQADLFTKEICIYKDCGSDNFHLDSIEVILPVNDTSYTIYVNETKERHCIIIGQISFINSKSISENKIYPNPANDIINVEIESNNTIKELAKIVDINGNIIYSEHVILKNGINNLKFQVSSLNKGVYFLTIGGNYFKFIKTQGKTNSRISNIENILIKNLKNIENKVQGEYNPYFLRVYDDKNTPNLVKFDNYQSLDDFGFRSDNRGIIINENIFYTQISSENLTGKIYNYHPPEKEIKDSSTIHNMKIGIKANSMIDSAYDKIFGYDFKICTTNYWEDLEKNKSSIEVVNNKLNYKLEIRNGSVHAPGPIMEGEEFNLSFELNNIELETIDDKYYYVRDYIKIPDLYNLKYSGVEGIYNDSFQLSHKQEETKLLIEQNLEKEILLEILLEK